eukprot:CAMPEP_0204909406 /NCGR_PEP_ID=MMETSP1397-20131031/8138_1 /ASSEMBLY_ACC=CAM_ASM_000891 /TAXON_ID=49980 /ORGANISM="Climacostomum Climacostomum virens, Strain Stock W-24" /LENGTH=172 /DNA_ID=CAMNT_0052079231 /DNA_START=139 /DNA_END=657 /DNA_ORIENTATION=+
MRVLGNHVTDYYVQGNLPQALKASQELVKHALETFGANSLQSASAYDSLGLVLLETGDYEKSTSCLTVSSKLFEHFYGASHFITLTSKANLAESQHFQGLSEESIKVLSAVIEGFKDTDKLLCAKYSIELAHRLITSDNTERSAQALKIAEECLDSKPNKELKGRLELLKRA